MQIEGRITPERVDSSVFSIRAPNMEGQANSVPTATSTRSGRRSQTLDRMPSVDLAGSDISVVGRLDIDLKPKPGGRSSATRSGEAHATVLMPPIDSNANYAAHYIDDITGAEIWVFPKQPNDGKKELAFELPGRPDDVPVEPGKTRALITKAMRGLVTVVTWVTDPIVGAGVNTIAKLWENKRRPYALHQVTADGKMIPPDWSAFNGEPALLLMHGTFSTPDGGFYGWLGQPAFAEMHKHYGGRCLALAHPSMHADPAENVDWLLEALPTDRQWKFNAVSHSRGGLVVRELAARSTKDGSCQVDRMVMVAPPNFGTPLANAVHWTTFLNTYTNILTDAPDTVTTIVTEGLLCLVKIIGSAATHGLSGIASMNVEDNYLKKLAPRAYLNPDGLYAIASDYSPSKPEIVKQIAAKAADVVIDGFFKEANDMVVPTLGCSQGSLEAAGFPIVPSRLKVLKGSVHHCNYFEQAEVHKQLKEWLA
jgi:pimeloyl-ACP methyl ester carboxylesterase